MASDDRADARYREADAVKIGLAGNAGDVAWKRERSKNQLFLLMDAVGNLFAVLVGDHANDTVELAGEQRDLVHGEGGDYDRILLSSTLNGLLEGEVVVCVRGPEAKVNDLNIVLKAPVYGTDDDADVGG